MQILIMRIAGLLLTLLIGINIGFAQQTQPKRYTTPLCGSVILRDLEDKYNLQVYNMEMPGVEGREENERLKDIKAESAGKFPRKATKGNNKKTTAPMPLLGINFVADSLSGVPPDNYMAISKGKKAVSVLNSYISVHDVAAGTYTLRKNLLIFSVAIGLTGANDFRFDPKIVYDPEADKYICVMLNGTNQYNYIVFGFSQTNDPTGSWNFYKLYGDYSSDTTWFDYPAISITKNDFFLTGNKIKYDSSWQAGFKKTLIYQIRKEDGYSGDATLNYQIWDSVTYNGKYIRCLYPLNPGDSLQNPAQYFLSNKNFDVLNDSVFLVKVPDTIGGTGSLTVTPIVSSLSYGVPPNGRQPDTSLSLATNDGRILGGYVRGNEIQFVNTSVNPVNGNASVYHGVISNFSTAPTLQGHIYSLDSFDFGYPNISYTGNTGGVNQSIISFNYSGSNTYPAFGAIFFDGSAYSNMLTIKSGDSTIRMLAGKEQRWGDYSGTQPDFAAIGTVWVEGIYGKKNRQYGDYMAQLKSPFYTTKVKDIIPAINTRLYPNPAWEFMSFEFNLSASQPVSFTIVDIQGKVVDEIAAQYCREGKNLVQFNIAPLPTGTYFLKINTCNNEPIKPEMFIRKP